MNDIFRVNIKNLTFKAIIGILDFERVKKQRVLVNLSFEYQLDKNFIDYSKVIKIIKKEIKREKFYLIEDAIEHIFDIVIKKYNRITKIDLEIQKPDIIENVTVSVSKSIKL